MKVIMPVYSISDQFINLTENAVNSLGDGVFLIIIDNGSTHGAGQLREWADLYIRNKENLGYAKAVNQGLKMCDHGEIVAIANNDIRISPGWQKVSKAIMKDISVGSVHFRMIPYDQPFSPGDSVWIGDKERWCSSSFFVMRNVQLYDENFLNSYDDWDYWKRMRNKGFIQAYTNKVEYQHMDSFTQQLIENRKEIDKQNREYFKTKHGGYPEDLFEKEFPGMLALNWKPFP